MFASFLELGLCNGCPCQSDANYGRPEEISFRNQLHGRVDLAENANRSKCNFIDMIGVSEATALGIFANDVQIKRPLDGVLMFIGSSAIN